MKRKNNFTFGGFDTPSSNYFKLPKEWTDLTSAINTVAEIKVVEYVLKHTWGFQEFGLAKRISINEFMSGRKTRGGERMDKGTGLSKPAVIDGLQKAVAHGLLIEEIDDTDKARVRKSYALKMRGDSDVKSFYPDVKDIDPDVKSFDISGKNSLHRTEKDTLGKNNVENNVANANKKWPKRDKDEIEYYAEEIANKLGDHKSISFYKLVCKRHNPQILLEKAAEIMADGGARNPGAVFAEWAKTLH